MFKVIIKTPIISSADFAALLEVRPNLEPLADTLIMENPDKAELAAAPKVRATLVKYEYISSVYTASDEAEEFWVSEFTIHGD